MRFAAEIADGKTPPEALRSASDLLDAQVADKMDDKTLLSHIKRWFETEHAPRTNAGWRKIIDGRMIDAFGPFAKEFRDLSP